MGFRLIDQYSYLHFVVGATIFYFNISLFQWFVLHTLFEILENTTLGIYTINNYLTFWPGGKPKADSIENNIGDTIFALLGWISALLVNNYAIKNKLYFE
jgi:hypothetical protein